jgi:hypothetical protein
MPHPLNGIRVFRRPNAHAPGHTLFIPLPPELWTSAGLCSCDHCKGPDGKGREGFWDTLALSAESPVPKAPERTWTVHYPELQSSRPVP